MAVETFFSLKIVQSALVIITAWLVSTYLPKTIHKIDKKSTSINFSKTTHELLKRVISFTTYLTALVLLAYISEFDKSLFLLFATKSFEAKILQLILVWLAIFIFTKYLASSFKQLDDAIKEIDLSEHFHALLRKTLNYTAYTIGIITSLQILELTSLFTALLAGAGIAGIVIGFAAKDVFSNLLGGIFIVLDRPFKIGDSITVKGADASGTVREISLRSTEIITSDNLHVFIPNSLIATNPVINYSIEKFKMIEINIGISYDANVKTAIQTIKNAVEKSNLTIKEKPTDVLIDLFSDSNVTLRVRTWIESRKPSESLQRKNEVMQAIYANLKQNGIEIPYPQRVIRHVYDEKSEKKKNK